MAEGRKVITVGREYRATFNSLVTILNSGRLENAAARTETDFNGKIKICTDTTEYVYDERADAAAAGKVTLAMQGDGASWFAPVRRGKTFDDGTSEWKQLIYRIARDFHDEFSIIEYKECDGSGGTDGEVVADRVKKIADRFFGGRGVTVIKGNDREKGTEDIYGASVKLELSGTGQSHYVVMSKIYFRRNKSGVFPISGEAARQINARLETAQDNDDPIRLTIDETAAINTVTVNAVRDLVMGNYPVSFKDSLCFSERLTLDAKGRPEENYDLKTYRALASRAHANNAPVTCNSVQVLGVSHVRWVNDYYEIALDGKVVLQAVVGFGGSMTLRCLNCNGADLITSDTVTYTEEDEEGNRQKRTVILNYSSPDLGVDDKTLKNILTHGEMANHLMEVKCERNSRLGKNCVKRVCRSQAVVIEGKTKCAACPYPEVVYTDYSGDRPIRYLTGQLTFVNDRLAMALREDAGRCSRCNRSFSKDYLSGGLCKLCNGAERAGESGGEEARKLYRRYRNALPQTVRIKHLFGKKYCFEDDTAVLFSLGGETFVLSKLELGARGFLTAPKKIS